MTIRGRWALAAAVVMGAVGWSALILAVPGWRAMGPPRALVASIVDALADRVCHQRPERSFFIDGAQMPVCARCTGLYLSGAAGALVACVVTIGRRVEGADDAHRLRWVLMASALPTAVSWGLEVSGLASPSMVVRAVCALPLGAVAGWICVRVATGALR